MRSIQFAVLTAVALTTASVSNGAQLLTFNTFGNAGTETTEPSTSNATGVAPASLTLGSGITPAGNGNRFGGNNWGSTLAESISGNDYIQFVLTPVAGFEVDVTKFSFIFDRSGTGPNAVALRSSADSFGTNLGQASVSATTSTFTNLSFSVLNRTSPVTFRLYGYGSSGTAGTGGFDTASSAAPNVIVEGEATAVVVNANPIVVSPAPQVVTFGQIVENGAAFSVQVAATDANATDILSLVVGTLPAGVSDISVVGGGTSPEAFTVSGIVDYSLNLSTVTIPFSVNDGQGGSTAGQIFLTVVPEPTTLLMAGSASLLFSRRRRTAETV